jgi:hypothetical protein
MRKRYLSLLFVTAIAGFLWGSSEVYAQVETRTTTVTASVASLPTIDPGGGGGSGSRSGVRFSGLAYPRATVTLLLLGQTVATTTADAFGRFSFVFTEVGTAERLFFSMYAIDTAGRRSTLLNFPVLFYTGELTDISGVRFAPTLFSDKALIKQNDYIVVGGAGLPRLPIELLFEGPQRRVFFATPNEGGAYSFSAPLSVSPGAYLLRARYENDTRTSPVLRLIVGAASMPTLETNVNIPGDCNVDRRVTLVDFSVLAFWFNKPNPPACVDTNSDGVINLVDFSILAFYWNG